MIFWRIYRKAIRRFFILKSFIKMWKFYQLMISSFPTLYISYTLSSQLSLIEKSNKKINTLWYFYMIRPNNRSKSKSKFWGIVKHLLRLLYKLWIYFWCFLYYFSYLFNGDWVLRLDYVSRIHSLANRRHLNARLVWRLYSICIEIFSSWRLVTVCITLFKWSIL